MTNLAYRNEFKHIITVADAAVLRSRLSCVLRLDPHARPEGSYHVRSLYFDTPEDRALRDKIDGAPMKEKFRIRLYNHDHSFIRLEKKVKHYGKAAKLGARVTREEVQDICRGEVAFLRDSDQVLLREFYLKVRTERWLPRTVVDYLREAYLHRPGNVRVTLDSDVRASINATDLFDADLPTAPALEPGICILEVKFDGFLPEVVQDIIQLGKCSPVAVSKYAACRVYT
ncbi:MAG: polyphosphate polymerase domain-containing protein [bacterium]|nr:polyphosphate polymerase domain-containing protein [bacterium]